MALEQRRDLTDLRRARDLFRVGGHLHEVFPHGLFHEQALGILRQHGNAAAEQLLRAVFLHRLAEELDFPSVWAADAADGFERCGFARAVAAENGGNFPGRNLRGHAAQDVPAVFFIPEPQLLQTQRRVFDLRRSARGFGLDFRRGGKFIAQPVASLPDGQRAFSGAARAVKDAHGCGHGGEHGILLLEEQLPDGRGRAVCDDLPAVHHDGAVGVGENVLEPVLGDDDGRAELGVDLAHGIEKIARGDGVKLARRLVEDQYLRLHRHDGSEIQKLLLSAGERGHIAVEPVLNAEIAGHFRHTRAHGRLVAAETFEPERELVPDLVRDDLIVRVLHHEADLRGLVALGYLRERRAAEENLAAAFAVRREHRLEMAQQRGLAAAGASAEHEKFPRADAQRNAVKRELALRRGVRKGQILDIEMFH